MKVKEQGEGSRWGASPPLAAGTGPLPEGAGPLLEGIGRRLLAGPDLRVSHGCILTSQCSWGMQGDS